MSTLKRFSVSVEEEVLDIVDAQVRDGRFPSRSDAFRAMIRHEAGHAALRGSSEVIGVLGVVYDHHKRNLVNKMLHVQHETVAKILGAQHFHLDHQHCVETILVRGKSRDLDALLKSFQAIRGLTHATLSVIAPATL